MEQGWAQGDFHSANIFHWQKQGKAERGGRVGLVLWDARDLDRARKKKRTTVGKVIKRNEEARTEREFRKSST